MLLNRPDNPRKWFSFLGDLHPHLKTWFFGPTRVFIQNGISIGSAVFAQLTVECPPLLYNGPLRFLKNAPSPYTVYVTGCDLEKFFVFEKMIEITSHVLFLIHVHLSISLTIHAVYPEVCKIERFHTSKVTLKVTKDHR